MTIKKDRDSFDPAGFKSSFTNEQDLETFSQALNFDADNISSTADDTTFGTSLSRVPTISSQSDWKPIFNRTRGRHRHDNVAPAINRRIHGKRSLNDESSWSYSLLHYPLLFITLTWLTILSLLYALVRFSIHISEILIIAKDRKRSALLKRLETAKNYDEYVEIAIQLDQYLGSDSWCHEDKYRYYDWKTLRRLVRRMRLLRSKKMYRELMLVLQGCVKTNFAGIENPIMYSHCYYGTKDLIEEYISEVTQSLDTIVKTDTLSNSDKHIFFKIISRNYGKTALALSGGASFCYNHFGVIKALLENNLLPQIISGTSGGGAIAGLVGTRTNDELLKLLVPRLATKIDMLSSEPVSVWLKRWWKTGAKYDAVNWARSAQWWTMGSMTFKESHERTGKMLNISTVPHDIHSPTILCNEVTSPNCCIWSSILASAAVPGILQPVVLMQKSKEGEIAPFSFGNRWRDGSLRTDIPLEALNTYYNVTFSIVSQVNPHVMLWIFKNRGDVGNPVVRKRGKTFRGGFIPSYLENLIKLEIIKWLKLIHEFQLLPNLAESDWSNIFLQRFDGNVTLFPKIRIWDYLYIMTDPTQERFAEIISNGEHVAYPKLLFIRNRLLIEQAIAKGRNLTRRKDRPVSPERLGHDEEMKYQQKMEEGTFKGSRSNEEDEGENEDEDDISIYSNDVDSFYGDALQEQDYSDKTGFLGIQTSPAVIRSDAESIDFDLDEQKPTKRQSKKTI